jgi:hypothetical protein
MKEAMGRGKGISKREKMPIRKKNKITRRIKKKEEFSSFFLSLLCFFLFITTKKKSRISFLNKKKI